MSMKYFVERASSYDEAERIVFEKYQGRARIMLRKEIMVGGVLGLFRRRAVEVQGYYDPGPLPRGAAQRPAAPVTPEVSPEQRRRQIIESALAKAVAERSDARSDENHVARATSTPRTGGSAPPAPESVGEPAATESARSANGHVSPAAQTDLDAILGEIRSLRQAPRPAAEHPHLARVRTLLDGNDFSMGFMDETIAWLRNALTVAELDEWATVERRVRERIADSIAIRPWREGLGRPNVFVLVGPTGVGKTTTIAKLAATYGPVHDPPYDVRIITIDSYRIGALQQIQKYGDIMGVPVEAVDTIDDMEAKIELYRDADIVFVDTIGKSPQDFGRLAEVHDLVKAADGEVHLAMSATTKRRDMVDIMRQFEPFNYRSVVVTKLDETTSVGGIVSALAEQGKAVSFVTDGQNVPQDICTATTDLFLRRVRGIGRGASDATAGSRRDVGDATTPEETVALLGSRRAEEETK